MAYKPAKIVEVAVIRQFVENKPKSQSKNAYLNDQAENLFIPGVQFCGLKRAAKK